jgi:hypothetical protein
MIFNISFLRSSAGMRFATLQRCVMKMLGLWNDENLPKMKN